MPSTDIHLHLVFLNCMPDISCGNAVKCPNNPLPELFSMLFNFVTINVQVQCIAHPQLSTDTNNMHTDLNSIKRGFVNTKRIVLL